MTDKTVSVATRETEKTTTKTRIRVREMTFISLMGALSAVLMLFRFPLPFLPPFMSFDFSAIVEMIGGFMFGPVAAFLIIMLKILLQLVMQGTKSLGTGELQNLILSCSYVLPAVLLYCTKKSKRRAVGGMGIGTITVSIAAVFSNIYLIIPFYAKLYGMKMEDIVAMCAAVNPAVKDIVSMVLIGIVPFNIIKYGICSILTLLVYKHLSRPIKSFINR